MLLLNMFVNCTVRTELTGNLNVISVLFVVSSTWNECCPDEQIITKAGKSCRDYRSAY